MENISEPAAREQQAAPLLQRQRPSRRRFTRWRVLIPAVIVFLLAAAVSLVIFFLISKSEKATASTRFAAEADDLASKLTSDVNDKLRDARDIAARTGSLAATYGAIPHRKTFQQIAEATRINPASAAFVGISLALNVSQSQRPQFEAGMSAENNKTIVVFTPSKSSNGSAPIRPSHTTNLVATVGTESAKGFATGVLSWSWSEFSPSSDDLTRRLPRSGRALTSMPSALSTSLARYSIFFLIQSPVLVDPVAYSRWSSLALTADTVDIGYCFKPSDIGTGSCDPSFGRQPPDARMAFTTTMTAIDVPIYGLLNNNSKSPAVQSEILPICKPALKFDLRDPYSLDNKTTSFKFPNGSCLPVANQYLRAQAPFIIGKKRMLALGLVSCSLYAQQLILNIVSQFRSRAFLLAAEDVTGQEGFDFVIRSRSPDSWISALPEEAWFQQTQRNQGKPVVDTSDASSKKKSLELPEGGGTVNLERSSFNRLLWQYSGPSWVPTFPSGLFVYALDAREATIKEATQVQARKRGPECTNFTTEAGGNTTLISCLPNLTPQQFDKLYKETDPAFTRTFVTNVGDRLWRIHVVGPNYNTAHSGSLFALIGGLALAVLLTALTVGATIAREESLRRAESEAEAGAHEMVTSMAVHEVRNCLHALSGSLSLLKCTLPQVKDAGDALKEEGQTALLQQQQQQQQPQGAAISGDPNAETQQLLQSLAEAHQELGPSVSQLEGDVATMVLSTELLLATVNDFSDFAKLRSGRFDIKRRLVQVRPVIVRAVYSIAPMARVPVVLWIDPALKTHRVHRRAQDSAGPCERPQQLGQVLPEQRDGHPRQRLAALFLLLLVGHGCRL